MEANEKNKKFFKKLYVKTAKVALLAVLFVLVFSSVLFALISDTDFNLFNAVNNLNIAEGYVGQDYPATTTPQTIPQIASSSGAKIQIERSWSDAGGTTANTLLRQSDWNIYNRCPWEGFGNTFSWQNADGNGWGSGGSGGGDYNYGVAALEVPLGADIISALRNGVKIGISFDAYYNTGYKQDYGILGIHNNLKDAASGWFGENWHWTTVPNNIALSTKQTSGDISTDGSGRKTIGGSTTHILQSASNIVLAFHGLSWGDWGFSWDDINATFYYQSSNATFIAGANGSISDGGTKTYNSTTDTYSFTATPNPGYIFKGWKRNGTNDIIRNREYSSEFTGAQIVPGATYTAIFEKPTYSGGNGTSGNAYVLSNRQDFDDLSNVTKYGWPCVNEYFIVRPDSSNGQNSTTINMRNTSFTPIGQSNRFKGNFNGNNCSIINLKIDINLEIDAGGHSGLFGFVDADGAPNAKIYNLTVRGSINGTDYVGVIAELAGGAVAENITNYANVTASGNYVGGIVGIMHSTGRIIGCHNYGTVHSSGNDVGGILGRAGGVSGAAAIKGCVNHSTVYSSGNNVGGILGILYNSGAVLSVENCRNEGAVYSTGGTKVGGIIGTANGTSGTLYVKGEISNGGTIGQSGYKRDHTGGIAGETTSRFDFSGVTSLTNSGTVYGGNGTGGIIGYNNGCSLTKGAANSGAVYGGAAQTGGIVGYSTGGSFGGSFTNTGKISGGSMTGGIGGQFHSSFADGTTFINGDINNKNHSSSGNISGTGDSVGGIFAFADKAATGITLINYGSVNGVSSVGGIIGRTQNSVANAENYGNVTASGSAVTSEIAEAGSAVGGITGYSNSNITNCKNYGAVTANGSNAGSFTGGITGTFLTGSAGTVSGCENNGVVNGKGFTGGIAGSWNGTVSHCLNDAAVGGSTSVGGIAGRGAAVTYCVNKGTVSGTANVGGIVGTAAGRVTFCYGIGNVSSASHTADIGALAGNVAGGGSVSSSWGFFIGTKPANINTTFGNVAVINLNGITLNNIIPYNEASGVYGTTNSVNGTLVWKNILTDDINAWGLQDGNIANINTGQFLSIADGSNLFKAPNVLETNVSGGNADKLGCTVTLDKLKFKADNNAGYITISVKGATVTGTNANYTATNHFNDPGRWTVSNLPDNLAGKLDKFLYFKNSKITTWTKQTGNTAVNAGEYNLSVVINGFSENNPATNVVLGSTPEHNSLTFKINPAELKPATKVTNGWNSYIYNGFGRGISNVSIGLQGNDKLESYINAFLKKGSGNREPWIPTGTKYNVAEGFAVHVCDSGFSAEFEITQTDQNKFDNYIFAADQEVTQFDDTISTVGIGRTEKTLKYNWTISPFVIDAGKVSATATNGWNTYIYSAEHQGVGTIRFSFDDAEYYIKGSLLYTDINGAATPAADVTLDNRGEVKSLSAKNAGTYKLSFVIDHDTPEYSQDYIFAEKGHTIIADGGNSADGISVSGDRTTINYTWNINPFDFGGVTVRYDGLSGGYDAATGEYIDKANFDGLNKYVSGGFVWYDGQLAANKDRASINGKTLFIMYNYGLTEASFGRFLFKEDNQRTNTEDRLIKFFIGDPSKKHDIISEINADKGSGNQDDWERPIIVSIDNYTVNGVSYATFTFSISGSNNYKDGSITLTAFITDGDYEKSDNLDSVNNSGSGQRPYKISNWLYMFRMSQIVNGLGTPFDSVQGLGVFGLKDEKAANGKYGGAFARPTYADNGNAPLYYNKPYDEANGYDTVNATYANAEGISYAGAYFSLTADLKVSNREVFWSTPFIDWSDAVNNDIDVNGGAAATANPDFTTYYFRPIGNRGTDKLTQDNQTSSIKADERPFAGAFDGGYTEIDVKKRHSITIDTAINGANAGEKFDLANEDYVGFFGFVRGGAISNLTVNGNVNGHNGVGGVVGGIVGGSVKDCMNAAVITGNEFVGGLIGYAWAFVSVSDIVNEGSVNGVNNVGGIGGTLRDASLGGDLLNGTDGTSAKITATGDRAGGITGHFYGANDGTATLIVNKMDVIGVNKVGGIAGAFNWGAFGSAENYGTVTATGDYAGGILGIYEAPGNLDGYFVNQSAVSGANKVGGIIGGINAIYGAENAVDKVNFDGDNRGNVTGTGNAVGGIIGFYKQEGTIPVALKSAKNRGLVTGANSVGGIVGEAHGGQVGTITYNNDNKPNPGNIQVSDDVRGDQYVGGIIGQGDNVNIQINHPYMTVESTENGTPVKVYGGGRVGGLFGEFSGTGFKNSKGELKRYSRLPWFKKDEADSGLLILGDAKPEIKGIGAEGTFKGGYIGALAGKFGEAAIYADNGYQTPMYNDITVNVQIGYEKNYVGGVIGYIAAGGTVITGKTVDADNGISSASIENTNSINASGSDYVGGLFGCVEAGAGAARYNEGTLEKTRYFGYSVYLIDDNLPFDAENNLMVSRALYKNTSIMKGDLKSITGAAYVGGMIGGTSNTGNNLFSQVNSINFNKMNIRASGDYVGGFIGYISSNFVLDMGPNYNIEGKATTVGGQNGYKDGTEKEDGTIVDNISIEGGANYVGGIVGYVSSNNNHIFNRIWSTATVVGGDCVGGFFGMVKSMQVLRNSFVTLPNGVSKTSKREIVKAAGLGNSSESGSGGIVGRIEKGTFESVYVIGYKYDSFNPDGTVKEIGGNLSSYSGGIAGYAEASGVSTQFDMAGALYVSGAGDVYPDFQASSHSKYGSYMIVDSDILNALPNVEEMLVISGITSIKNFEKKGFKTAASDPVKLPVMENTLSAKFKIPDGNQQLVFYDASGYDVTSKNQAAMINDDTNQCLYGRLKLTDKNNGAIDVNNFSICKTKIVFQNVPRKGSSTDEEWEKVWQKQLKRPNNDQGYKAVFDTGYPQSVPPDNYPYKAAGSLQFKPFINIDGTPNGDHDYNTTGGNYVIIGKFDITYNPGDSGAPKIINNQQEWNEFAKNVRENTADGGYGNGQFFKLGDDVTDSGAGSITVILNPGTGENNLAGDVSDGENETLSTKHFFSGTFDGNGKTLNVNINTSGGSDKGSNNSRRLGVFPNAANATFTNLTLDGSIVTKTNSSDDGYDVAAFVGKAFGKLTFTNCKNSVDITARRLAAGFTGYVRTYSVELVSCINEGNIYTKEGIQLENGGELPERRIYSYGTGGLIAMVQRETKIESCINTGNITGSSNIGGLVGRADSHLVLKNCANKGAVESKGINEYWYGQNSRIGTNVFANAGGLVGYTSGDNPSGEAIGGSVDAYACYNSGRIYGMGNCVGGLFGMMGSVESGNRGPNDAYSGWQSKIMYCYNNGVAGIGNEKNKGTASNSPDVNWYYSSTCAGGIIGTGSNFFMSYTYNVGEVFTYGGSTNGPGSKYYANVGGLVGFATGNNQKTITNSYNAGKLYVYNDHNEWGKGSLRYAAGIVGCLYDNAEGHVTADDGVFSLKNQIYYAGYEGNPGYYSELLGGGGSEWIRNGTVLDSLADYTAVYKGSNANSVMPKNQVLSDAWGGSSVETLVDINGNYRKTEDLASGNLSGFVYAYGCLPQLAVFALDTKNELSMLSQSFGSDQYGNIQQNQAGSEEAPYIIKDGIDLSLLSRLVNSSAGSQGDTYWHGTHKYIEFAGERVDSKGNEYFNNIAKSTTRAIRMPIDGRETNAFKYQNSDAALGQGKNYFLYERGAVVAKSPGVTDDSTYNAWKSENKYYNGSGWQTGATLANFNFLPIGMNAYGCYFGGDISGTQIKDGNEINTEITGLNVDYTVGTLDNKRTDVAIAGLFGKVQNATIKNITVTGSVKNRVIRDVNGGTPRIYTGGIVGLAYGACNFENLQAGNSIIFPASEPKRYNLSVESRYSDTNILTDDNTGGIVGKASTFVTQTDGTENSEPCTANIVNCKSYADVKGARSLVGGIVGCAVAAPDTTLNFNGCKTLKGLIGVSANSGGADGDRTVGSYIGGTAGGVVKITNGISSTVAGTVTFIGCTVGNNTIVSAQETGHNVVICGENTVGGIVGNTNASVALVDNGVYGDVKIEKAVADKNKSVKSANKKGDTGSPDVFYGSCIGGITGFIKGGTTISGTTVSAGFIFAESNYAEQVISNVGGVAGFLTGNPELSGNIQVKGEINVDPSGFYKNKKRADDPNFYAVSGIGGIAGEASTVVFDGAYDVTATINAPSAGSVGGIIGYNNGDCIILAAKNNADINKVTVGGAEGSTDYARILGYDSVGGIIGSNSESGSITVGLNEMGGTSYDGKLQVKNYALVDGQHRVSGIQGKNAGTTIIKSSATVINAGKVGTLASDSGSTIRDDALAEITASNFFGGIVAFNAADGTLTFETGSVLQNEGQVGYKPTAAEMSSQYFVGGVIGSNAGTFTNNGTLSNTQDGKVYGYKYVGGSIGRLKSGTISGTLINEGAVSAYANVGGSIGEVSVNGKITGAVLENNGAVGAWNRTNNFSVENNNVGGIIGTFHGTIQNSNFINNGTVGGWDYVGGAIGVITGTVSGSNFINHGLVSTQGVNCIGGAVGYITDTYPHSNENTQALSVAGSHFEYSAVGGAAGGAGSGDALTAADGCATGAADVINPVDVETYLYAGRGLPYASASGGVGGVIGVVYGQNNNITADKWQNITIYVNGSVTAPNASNVGGVVGVIANAAVQISNMLAYKNKIEGYKNVGGIIGYNGSSLTDNSIVNCYNVEGEVKGADHVGGIVGAFAGQNADGSGSANSPSTNSCYWVKGFLNESLQDATEENLSTANMEKHDITAPTDRKFKQTDPGYEQDFEDGYTGEFSEEYLAAYLEFLKETYGTAYEENGHYIYYKQKEGTTEYTTGNEYTGYFFAYANDAQSLGIALSDIKTEHSELTGTFTNLQFWKYIANAYTKEERENDKDKEMVDVSSDIVLRDRGVGQKVKPGHIFAKALSARTDTTSAGNGYYLYATQNKNNAENNSRLDSTKLRQNTPAGETDFYYDIDAAEAGNVLMFYKQLKVRSSITYNGNTRYAPVYNIGYYNDDQDKNLVFDYDKIDLEVKGGYTFVLGKQADRNNMRYNFATDNNNNDANYGVDGKVFIVDYDGVPRQVGQIETVNDNEYVWKIVKRPLKTTSTSNQAANKAYDTTFNHYIEISVENIAVKDAPNPADNFTSENNMKFNFTGSAYFTWLNQFQRVTEFSTPTSEAASHKVFYTYSTSTSPVTVQGNGNNLSGGAFNPQKSASPLVLIKYTFRVYFKDAEKYSLTLATKKEPSNDVTEWVPGARHNYNLPTKEQDNNVERVKLSVDGVSYYNNGKYENGAGNASHVWDGYNHGIRLSFGGFAGRENGDTKDVDANKRIIEILNEVITCSNSGKVSNSVEKINNVSNALQWVATDQGEYIITLTNNALIGKNYTLSASPSTYKFTITKYLAGVTFGWSNGETFEYSGKDRQLTAEISGDTLNNGGKLSQSAWESFTAALKKSIGGNIKLAPAGKGIKVDSTYNQNTVYKATVTFKVKDVGSASGGYSASVGLSDTNANFTLTPGVSSFKITPKEVYLLPSERDKTKTYDGKYLGIGFTTSLGAAYGDDRLSAAADYAGVDESNASGVRNYKAGGWTISNADLFVNGSKFNPSTNFNYNITETKSGKIAINQKKISVNWSNPGPFTYRGGITPQLPTAAVTSGVSGERINVKTPSISGVGGGIDAGDYIATVSATGFTVSGTNNRTANYILSASSQNYTINPKEITVNWDDNNLKRVYDGKNQMENFVIHANGAVGGETIVLDWSEANPINVGKYEIDVSTNFTVSDGRGRSENYTLTGTLTGNIEITPKTITVTWTNESFVYTATEHSPTATATQTVGGDTVTFSLKITATPGVTLIDNKAVNAGNYNVEAIIATVSGGAGKLGDYVLDGASNKTTMTITPATLTVKLNDRSGKAFKQFDPTAPTSFGKAINVNGNTVANSMRRSGFGFSVSGLQSAEASGAVTINAWFEEAENGRTEFDGYINNVIHNATVEGGYSIDRAKHYKKLKFTKTETNETHNYTVEIVTNKDSVCSASFGGSGQETGYVFDSGDDSHKLKDLDYTLKIEITKFNLHVSYKNTVQSYVNDNNTFKDPEDWLKVEGSVDAKYKVGISVTQGWQAPNPKKYTVINGVKGNSNLGATIETGTDGIHINYDIYNQPTLVLGYFITVDDGTANKISTLSDLLLATYYYEMSISGHTPTTIDYKWKALCTTDEYNAEFPAAGRDILDAAGNIIKWTYSPGEGEKILTGTAIWDKYFEEYETAWKTWADDSGWPGANLTISVDVSEDGTEYGFMEPFRQSIEGVFFFNFKQTDNISGVMTDKDLEILNAQFGSNNWGIGTENLPNVIKSKAGNVVTVFDALFTGGKDTEDKYRGFAGCYDGSGYYIDGLNIVANINKPGVYNVGFIGYLKGTDSVTIEGEVAKREVTHGEVKGLNLRNVNIAVNDSTDGVGTTINVGGIAAYSTSGRSLENCSVQGKIEVFTKNSNVHIGGILGSDYYTLLEDETTAVPSVVGAIFAGSITVNTLTPEQATNNIYAGGITGELKNGVTVKNVVAFQEIFLRFGGTGISGETHMGGLIGHYEGADFEFVITNGIRDGGSIDFKSAYLKNGLALSSGFAANKAVGNDADTDSYAKTYTELRAGSASIFNPATVINGYIKLDGSIAHGEYDVVLGDADARVGLRLADIIDIYFLQFSIKREATVSGESTGYDYFRSASSWLVGTRKGTDNDKIKVYNTQQFEIARLLHFASLEIMNDITYPQSHVAETYSGAFIGSIKSAVGKNYTVNLRKGDINRLFELVLEGSIPNGLIVKDSVA